VTTGAIAAAQKIAKDRYGLDIGTFDVPTGTALNVTDKLVKLDWNVNDDHRVMVRYAKTEQADPIFPLLSATGISLNSTWYSQEKAIETKVAQWTADYDSVPRVNSQMPLVALAFSGALPAGAPSGLSTGNRFINFGTENSRQRNILGTKTDDVYLGANWSRGDHEIKFGGDYQNNKVYNAFLQNVYGNYQFNCSNNLQYNTVPGLSPTATSFDCAKATAAQVEAAVLENFSRGRPNQYQTQIANPGLTLEDAVAKFSMKNTGLFLQDTWTVNPRLTLNGGLRIDMNSMSDRPLANAVVATPTVARTAQYGRQTGGFGMDNTNTFDGQKLWQPRVGFNYQFDSARPMQLRGGAGLFQGAAATVWVSNAFSNPGVVTKTVGCGVTPFGACKAVDNFFSADINNQPVIAGVTPAANVDILAPGLRQPSVWKANIAFDHELPWYGVVFAAEFLKLDVKDGIYYQNLNLGAPTRTGTDGRQLFYTEQWYNTACWSGTASALSSGACAQQRTRSGSNQAFGNVLLASKTSKGGSNLMTLSLSRPLTAGFGWSVAYTYTEAKEVSPLTSSTSNSNWSGRSVFNPNEEVSANSSYLVKDRINAVVNFQKKFFGTYNTRFGLFYEGRSGKPYSWTINNDLNGDGLAGNDLMYIPSAPGSGEVVFRGDSATSHANEDKFWSIVNQNGVLKRAAGKVVDRNSDFAPWTNSFDVRVAQEIPSFFNGHKATFTVDIFNVGNLINRKWGRINEVGFQSAGAQARSFVDYVGLDANGKYIYQVRDKVEDLDVRQAKGESQWAIQATLKYEF
jgi:hypothetical protein